MRTRTARCEGCAQVQGGEPVGCAWHMGQPQTCWFDVGIKRVVNHSEVTGQESGKKPKKKPQDQQSVPALEPRRLAAERDLWLPLPRPGSDGKHQSDRQTPCFSVCPILSPPLTHSRHHLPRHSTPSLPRPHLCFSTIHPVPTFDRHQSEAPPEGADAKFKVPDVGGWRLHFRPQG